MRTLLRWLMRLVFTAVLGFGVLIGLLYPWLGGGKGFEIGRWRVYDRVAGFQPVEILLPTDERQILVRAELSTPYRIENTGALSVMTVTVASGDYTELAHYFSLDGVAPRQVSPQLPGHVYMLEAGALYRPGEAPYLFTFGPGEAEIDMATVDLVLIGGTLEIDEAVPPLGYGFMAIGFIGLALTFRRRREKKNPPPPPKWGR